MEYVIREAKAKLQEAGNPSPNPNIPTWTLYIDESSKPEGSGAGLVLIGPDGVIVEYALWFKFLVTNNEDEYEALVIGLKVTMELGVRRLKVFTDFQLVVGQVQGEYEAWSPTMSRFLKKV